MNLEGIRTIGMFFCWMVHLVGPFMVLAVDNPGMTGVWSGEKTCAGK